MLSRIIEIKTERAISPTGVEIADYVLNPYRGCGFGCIYCYAQKNKIFQKNRRRWGSFVEVKVNFFEKFISEIDRISPESKFVIGTVTDPFQPVEERYCITQNLLRFFVNKNFRITILTRSILIKNTLLYLKQIKNVKVYFTVNSENVRKYFEPGSFSLLSRLDCIKALQHNNIRVVLYISPYFPFITDVDEIVSIMLSEKIANLPVYIENYNLKMGNYELIKKFKILSEEFIKLHSSEERYNDFWEEEKERIKEKFKPISDKIRFFIYPYQNFYKIFF